MSGQADKGAGLGRDLAILIFANVVWGSTDVAAKYALIDLSPAAVAWTRFSIALIAFAPVLWIRRTEIPLTVSGLLPFVALGFCGFFGNFVLHYMGLSLAPASHATALRVSEALIIVLLSGLILREGVSRRSGIGLFLGLIGVVLVIDIDFSDLSLFTGGYRLGDILILCGIFVEALYTIVGKKVLTQTRPLTATALACAFGWGMFSLVYGPSILSEYRTNFPSTLSLIACAYLGLMASALCYWLWYRALSRRDSHRVGITIMAQPVVGIPLAALVLGETMGKDFYLGAVLIAFGVYLVFGRSDKGNAQFSSVSAG